jgi:hypothetical protein
MAVRGSSLRAQSTSWKARLSAAASSAPRSIRSQPGNPDIVIAFDRAT